MRLCTCIASQQLVYRYIIASLQKHLCHNSTFTKAVSSLQTYNSISATTGCSEQPCHRYNSSNSYNNSLTTTISAIQQHLYSDRIVTTTVSPLYQHLHSNSIFTTTVSSLQQSPQYKSILLQRYLHYSSIDTTMA